jgi:hypothetical protein
MVMWNLTLPTAKAEGFLRIQKLNHNGIVKNASTDLHSLIYTMRLVATLFNRFPSPSLSRKMWYTQFSALFAIDYQLP